MTRPATHTIGLLLALLGAPSLPSPARASDHRDGPAASMAPETDLGDVYAWLSSDKKTTYLVMTVFPDAGADARFSTSAAYAFHLSSRKRYGDAAPAATLDVVCKFDDAQRIRCWAGGEYASGDASALGGVLSRSGRLRVFAGRRADPAFFNQAGFDAFRAALKAAVTGGQVMTFDASGCPVLPMRASLLSSLREQPGMPGSRPVNAFGGKGVLALVVGIETSLIDKGGPIIGAWAATHRVAEGTP